MDADYLQHQLEPWKRWLYVCLGASAMLLAMALFDIPNADENSISFQMAGLGYHYFPNWYIVWFIWQAVVTPPGFLLLFVKGWRLLPLTRRLNTLFGFFLAAWMSFSGFALHANAWGVSGKLNVVAFGLGIVLGASYLWLRKKHLEPETIFP